MGVYTLVEVYIYIVSKKLVHCMKFEKKKVPKSVFGGV